MGGRLALAGQWLPRGVQAAPRRDTKEAVHLQCPRCATARLNFVNATLTCFNYCILAIGRDRGVRCCARDSDRHARPQLDR